MCLSVIHLSDIHIKDKDDLILSRVDELKRACVSSLPSNGIVVIVISGDIAQSGTKSQYELASGLLKSLSDYIVEQKGAQVKILCVPGNHDCDLTQDSSVRKKLIDSCRPDIIDDNYYNTVTSGIQSQYREFAESLGIDQSKFLPRVEISCGENNILFLLANTSWMSVLHEKPGRTIIPCHLFEKVSPDNYSIVFYVFHHPLNWLDPDYKKTFITHVRQNADIVLMGHEHERDSYEKTGDSFSVYCSHGKELQDRESASSAFNVINFDRA
ncbi:MAG: metallophosphoesterase, partial [Clostridia bacterium]|nr:metallophosphoesterase [Clostridia bacterium]